MAAYAAVSSLMHIIKQIQHHPHPPISYDKEQLVSLAEKVAFLQEFLEGYSHVVGYKKELDGVESRIANAAHAAEDIIESHVVDQILVGSTSRGKRISSVDFHEFLLKVEEDMESIRKEVVEIKEKIGVQWNYSSISVGSLRSSTWRKSTMVGFEDVLYKMKDRLTEGGPNLQIVSIVGMAGIGVFPEDSEISVTELIKLWAAEGFLKPIDGKSLEEVAKGYLEEILDRNLILVEMVGLLGKIKSFKIHDLLWDLCLREAKKQKFLYFVSETSSDIPLGVNTERRRICTRKSTPTEKYPTRVINALESATLARSLIWQFQEAIPSSGLKLLRVYSTISRGIHLDEVKSPETSDGFYSLEAIFWRLNLRYIYIGADLSPLSGFPSSVSLLWNLHTLIIDVSLFNHVTAPSEIWDMTQLRHVDCTALCLPNPPDGHMRVLAELQTLRIIMNFKFGEEMVKRIPNIKNLRIIYDEFDQESLKNLSLLPKLECLHLHLDDGEIIPRDLVHNLAFSHSLKKLSLNSNVLHWEDMNPTKIESLPLLQVLKLSIHGSHWETVEGQFCSLKVLLIRDCDLKYWMTEDTHFPRLEYLILERLEALNEIPSSLGDIPTLLTILLEDCSNSAVDSIKRLQEEQEELGNILLDVQVRP